MPGDADERSIRSKLGSISGRTGVSPMADDGNLHIGRQRTSMPGRVESGLDFAGPIVARAWDLAAPGAPHLPSIEPEVQCADEYAGNR